VKEWDSGLEIKKEAHVKYICSGNKIMMEVFL
jgi:hypothetical protein